MANPTSSAAAVEETLSMEVHKSLYQVNHDKEGVRLLCNMMSDATGSPEWGQVCSKKIARGLVPIEFVSMWNHNILSNENKREQFMLWGYDLYGKNDVYLTSDTFYTHKFIVEEKKVTDLLSSGTNSWDYDIEASNIHPLRSCFYEMQDDVPLNVHSLFTGIGFDKKLMEEKNEWGLCLHVQTGVNNRFIDLGFIFSSHNDTKFDSIWHYMTHFGIDKRDINDRLTNSDAICILTKTVNKDKLACQPKYKAVLAPYSDMWNKATGDQMDCSDLYTQDSIVGSPHAVPATYSDVKKLFKFFTNKEFEECYEVAVSKENMEKWNHDRKAVFCFSILLKLFHDPNSIFYISSHAGVYNLYCFFLRKTVPKEIVVRIYERAKALLLSKDESDRLEGSRILNLLFPNTMEELQLRLRFFWNKYVKLQMHPLEGQKRKITNIYNLLGLKPMTTPIQSFFMLSDFHRAPHRLNLNRRPRDLLEEREFDGPDEQFFLRTKVPIKTTLLGFQKSAPGLTIKQASIFRDISTTYAQYNTDVQKKLCNEHIRDMLMAMLDNTDVYAMNIDYTHDELRQNNEIYDKMEKNVKSQVVFMRRLFYEKFREKCSANEGLLSSWMEAWKSRLDELLVPAKKGVESIWERTRDPKKDSKKKDKQPRAHILAACVKFFDEFKDDWFQSTQLNKESFSVPRLDDIFVNPAHAFNPEKLRDLDFDTNWNNPKQIEYWLGIWCLNVKEGSGIGTMAHFIPDNPAPTVILSVLFSHAVFSKPALKNLVNLFQNNGQKSFKYPADCYYLDQIGPKPMKEYRPIKFFWERLDEGCWIKIVTLCVLEPAYTFAKIFANETMLAYCALMYHQTNCLSKEHVTQRYISCLCRDLVKSLVTDGRFFPVSPGMEFKAPHLYALLTQGSTVEISPDEDCSIRGYLFKNDLTAIGGTNQPLLLALVELMLLHDNNFLTKGLDDKESGVKWDALAAQLKEDGHGFRTTRIEGKTFLNVFLSARMTMLRLKQKETKKNALNQRGRFWQKSPKAGQKVGEYLDLDWEKMVIKFEIISAEDAETKAEKDESKKNKKKAKPEKKKKSAGPGEAFKIHELCRVISTGGCRDSEDARILHEFNFDKKLDPKLKPTADQQKILDRANLAEDLWERMENQLAVLDYDDKEGNPDCRAMVIALLKALRRKVDFQTLVRKDKTKKAKEGDEDDDEEEEEDDERDNPDEPGNDLLIESKLRNQVKKGNASIESIGSQYFSMGARIMFHDAAESLGESKLAYNTKDHFAKLLGQTKEGGLYETIGKTLYANNLGAVKAYVQAKALALSRDKDKPLKPDQVEQFFIKAARNTPDNRKLLDLKKASGSSTNASETLLKEKERQFATAKNEGEKFKRLLKNEKKESFKSMNAAAKNVFYSMKLTAYLNSADRQTVDFTAWKPKESGRGIFEEQLCKNPQWLNDEYAWYPKWVTEQGKAACEHVAAKQIETLRKFARLDRDHVNWQQYQSILKDTKHGAFSENVVKRLTALRNSQAGMDNKMKKLLDKMAKEFEKINGYEKIEPLVCKFFEEFEDQLRKILVQNAYRNVPDEIPQWFMQPNEHFLAESKKFPPQELRENLLSSLASYATSYRQTLTHSTNPSNKADEGESSDEEEEPSNLPPSKKQKADEGESSDEEEEPSNLPPSKKQKSEHSETESDEEEEKGKELKEDLFNSDDDDEDEEENDKVKKKGDKMDEDEEDDEEEKNDKEQKKGDEMDEDDEEDQSGQNNLNGDKPDKEDEEDLDDKQKKNTGNQDDHSVEEPPSDRDGKKENGGSPRDDDSNHFGFFPGDGQSRHDDGYNSDLQAQTLFADESPTLQTQQSQPLLRQDSDATEWEGPPKKVSGKVKRNNPRNPSNDEPPSKKTRTVEASHTTPQEKDANQEATNETDIETMSKNKSGPSIGDVGETPVSSNVAQAPPTKIVNRTPPRRSPRTSSKKDSESSQTGTTHTSGSSTRRSSRKASKTEKAKEAEILKKKKEAEKKLRAEKARKARAEAAKESAKELAAKKQRALEKKQQQEAKTAQQREKEANEKLKARQAKQNPFGSTPNSTLDDSMLS